MSIFSHNTTQSCSLWLCKQFTSSVYIMNSPTETHIYLTVKFYWYISFTSRVWTDLSLYSLSQVKKSYFNIWKHNNPVVEVSRNDIQKWIQFPQHFLLDRLDSSPNHNKADLFQNIGIQYLMKWLDEQTISQSMKRSVIITGKQKMGKRRNGETQV